MPNVPFRPDRGASTVHLPPGSWRSALDALCAHFPAISRAQWLDRIARGRVLDGDGVAIDAQVPYRAGMRLHYYREVADEAEIPFVETVVHADEHLVVADKPHFLPVTPAGGFVEQTLLRRLIRRLDNPQLVPLHSKAPQLITSMKREYLAADPHPGVILVHGGGHARDRKFAEHMRGVPGVSLVPLAGHNQHASYAEAVSRGMFPELYHRLLGLRPVGSGVAAAK